MKIQLILIIVFFFNCGCSVDSKAQQEETSNSENSLSKKGLIGNILSTTTRNYPPVLNSEKEFVLSKNPDVIWYKEYNNVGNIILEREINSKNEEGIKTIFEYDNQGNLTFQKEYDKTILQGYFMYVYNKDGILIEKRTYDMNDNLYNTIETIYDKNNYRLMSIDRSKNKDTLSYSNFILDSNGNEIEKITFNKNNSVISKFNFVYNKENELIKKTDSLYASQVGGDTMVYMTTYRNKREIEYLHTWASNNNKTKSSFSYINDEFGNWIKRENLNEKGLVLSISERTIIYNK